MGNIHSFHKKNQKLHTLPFFLMIFFFLLILSLIMCVYNFYVRQNIILEKKAEQPIKKKVLTTLALVPSTQLATINREFTEDIIIDTKDQTVTNAFIFLSYDATKLKVIEVKTGNFLPFILTPAVVKDGAITFALSSKPQSPKKGTGVLASIKFKTLSNKENSISFSDLTWVSTEEDTSLTMVNNKMGVRIKTE